MANEESITATILDRRYQFVCPKDEHEMLHACIALVDSRMKTVKKTGQVQTTEKIAIMASLTLARDFLNSGKMYDESNESKLEHLEVLVDEALAPQKKLFE
ncbi:MAG: hypothetical protein CBD16_01765 [Betaproteobacteria bacterium TMED156]|nr:MAG: hypothetical protein CBD16_01765 [Betaproteobacteria bacterium TMED156]|tara:strand:- start:2315 stop:2617 length:303 start_codon:yes stop_codon:yes gene_type:complete